MPPNVVAGQSFTVVVRRVTTFVEPAPPIIQSPALASPPVSPPVVRKPPVKGAKAVKPPARLAAAAAPRAWRYITGAFQVNIPVRKDKEILPHDENTLAIFNGGFP